MSAGRFEPFSALGLLGMAIADLYVDLAGRWSVVKDGVMENIETSIEGSGRIDLGLTETDALPRSLLDSIRPRSLYRVAFKLLGNEADAEDAVQDALLSACKKLNQFRRDAQFSTWVTAIVLNFARMQLRRRQRHTHVSFETKIGETQQLCLCDVLKDASPSPEDECQSTMVMARLKRSTKTLPACMRATFNLRYVDSLSLEEIADVQGIPVGTVKARLARARAIVQKSMQATLQNCAHSSGRDRTN